MLSALAEGGIAARLSRGAAAGDGAADASRAADRSVVTPVQMIPNALDETNLGYRAEATSETHGVHATSQRDSIRNGQEIDGSSRSDDSPPGERAALRIVEATDLPDLGKLEQVSPSAESVAAAAAASGAMAALDSQQKWSDLAAGDLGTYLQAVDRDRAMQMSRVRASFARLHMGWRELALSLARAMGCIETRRQALARERDAALLRRDLIRSELRTEMAREQREKDSIWAQRLEEERERTATARARSAELKESL